MVWSTVKLAVALVGFVTTLAVAATTYLLAIGKAAPQGLIAIGAGGIGALATLLTTASGRDPDLRSGPRQENPSPHDPWDGHEADRPPPREDPQPF